MEALQPVVELQIHALQAPVIVEALLHVHQALLALLVPVIVEARVVDVLEIPILALLTCVSVGVPLLVEQQIPFQIYVQVVRVNVGRLPCVRQGMFYQHV